MANSNALAYVDGGAPVQQDGTANAQEVLTVSASGSRPTYQNPGTNTAVTGVISNASRAGTYGLLAVSSEPEAATADQLVNATNVFYGALIYVPQTITTTKFVCNQSTGGTTTHSYAAILNTNGNTVVATADTTASALGLTNWSTSTVLTAGFYYIGIAQTQSVQPKFAGYAQFGGVTIGNLAGLVYATTGPFPKYVTSSSTITISSSFPTSVTLAAQASLGVGFFGLI